MSNRAYDNNPDRLICTTHAAKYWHCDTETIRKAIKRGQIKAVKAEDGYLWIPESELRRIKILPAGYPNRVRVRPQPLPRSEEDAERLHASLEKDLTETLAAAVDE